MEYREKKEGIWTKHQTEDGTPFYFNMAKGSFWELPSEKKNLQEENITSSNNRTDKTNNNLETSTYKRKHQGEELDESHQETEGIVKIVSTQEINERMSEATMKKLHDLKKIKMKHHIITSPTNPNSQYMNMVRELQTVDRDTDSSGGKWLVR